MDQRHQAEIFQAFCLFSGARPCRRCKVSASHGVVVSKAVATDQIAVEVDVRSGFKDNPCDHVQKLGLECVDKVRKPRNGARPTVQALGAASSAGGHKRPHEAPALKGSVVHQLETKLRCSEEDDDVYKAALRATLQRSLGESSSFEPAIPDISAPESAHGAWGAEFARWVEQPLSRTDQPVNRTSVQSVPVDHGFGAVVAAHALEDVDSLFGDSAPSPHDEVDLASLMPSSLHKLFRQDTATHLPPVQHWSSVSVGSDSPSLEPFAMPSAESAHPAAVAPSTTLPTAAPDSSSLDQNASSHASVASKAPSVQGSVHGWDANSIASRSQAAATTQQQEAAASGITMPGWTLASTLPLPAGASAQGMLRPRQDDSMEMRAAVARCSVPCFRMTFDHQVAGLENMDAQAIGALSVTDAVMRWVKGAKPQSTFANLEASQMLGLTQADFANAGSAQPLMLMHPTSAAGMLQQVHGMQSGITRVLSGATAPQALDKSAFPAKMLSVCGGERASSRSCTAASVMHCPTELAVQNGPMVRAPKGGLANAANAAFVPLDCVTYVGLEWWLPPGWEPSTMRRTVQEGLTASKVAQQWPRLRSVTCYILESKRQLAAVSTSGAVSVRTDSDSVHSVPPPTLSGGGAGGQAAPSDGATDDGVKTKAVVTDTHAVPGSDVREIGEKMLSELLQAQPGCFEGCWPASHGAMAAVLTAYLKSLFVLSRAAAEAVLEL